MTTHYLRTEGNKTIVDIECSEDDLRSVVCIDEYSKYLLEEVSTKRQYAFIEDMYLIQELRSIYFENPKWFNRPPDEMVKGWCKQMADKWHLYYVVD